MSGGARGMLAGFNCAFAIMDACVIVAVPG